MADYALAAPDFDALWDYDDPAASEAKFAALLPQARAQGDNSYLAQLLTQLARSQGLQRNFAQAHATLDEAATLLDASPPLARVRYLLERGRVFNSSGDKSTARELFLQARELGLQVGADNFTVDAIHMLAIVDPPEASLAWNQQAIALAEASADPQARSWLGALLYNSGWSLHDAGRFDEALPMFAAASQRWAEAGRDADVRIARWCFARTLRSQGNYAAALQLQQQYEREFAALGKPSGYVFEELGENLLALDRAQEAAPYFAQAYAILSQDVWLVAEEPARLQRLQDLATGLAT